MSVVGIDSMILVYAGIVPSKDAANKSPTLDDLQARSKLLLYQLTRKETTIVLPTVSVGELLVPVPASQRGVLIATLSERLVCPPYDLKAAAIAAEVWAEHKKLPADLQYKKRVVLKADAMIVASAKSLNATTFYSHDRNCRKVAELAGMAGRDLPRSDPDDMFALDDIKRGDF